MKEIVEIYKARCAEQGIAFSKHENVLSYDGSTFFCPAGMQQYKPQFKDESYSGVTLANVQRCLRLNDIESLGDGTHLALFNMLGMFSFRDWEVDDVIRFWLGFICDDLGVRLSHVTVHPNNGFESTGDTFDKWIKPYAFPTNQGKHYPKVRTPYFPIWGGDRKVIEDSECVWSDGGIGGYCTEFYSKGIEIGNIVNPLGTCIDVGFGLERLDFIVNGTPIPDKITALQQTIMAIIEAGVNPLNKGAGYELRRLLRTLVRAGGTLDHEFFFLEKKRQDAMADNYAKLKDKHPDKDAKWWLETHGISLNLLTEAKISVV